MPARGYIMTMQAIEYAILEDNELAKRAASADKAALEALLERHSATAVSFAYAVVGNREDAFDVAQDALVQIATYFPPLCVCLSIHFLTSSLN